MKNDNIDNLYIGTLNITLEKNQYKRESCLGSTCPSPAFTAWICAEDFNPDWWAQHISSIANDTQITRWSIVLALIIKVCTCRMNPFY